MAIQSVPSLMGLSKAPYASFAGKTEEVPPSIGAITDSTIQLRGQVRTLHSMAQQKVQVRAAIQTIEVFP